MAQKGITIKLAGEAGFGIKVAGATVGKVFSRMGYQIVDYTEYPSLIRGGHNTFEATIGEEVHHFTRPIHLLVALNQPSIDLHLDELASDAGIIFDPQKSKVPQTSHRAFAVPLSQITKEVGGSELMKNTVALGSLLAVLGLPVEGLLSIVRETFAKKAQAIIDENVKAAVSGYQYVKDSYPEPFVHQMTQHFDRLQIYITGNESVGLGAIAAGCRAYYGYPMTPSSSLLEFMAKRGPKVGMVVRQPEDEISVLNTAIGSAFMGIRSMVGTSGGGYSLMVEATGLAGITETPVVIYLGQRPGPATGLPTWSGQADLRFLMHAAQDEFPRIIIAPGDQEECFYLTAQAFNFAERYQMPVFVMLDKNLAEGGKTIPPLDQSKVKIERGEWVTAEEIKKEGKYLRFKVTDTGVSPRVLPGTEGGLHTVNSDEHDEYGYAIEDIANRNAQMDKRMRKLEKVLMEVPAPSLYGPSDAELTLVSWGSTKATILQAMEELKEMKVNFIHFTYLWPFPTPEAVEMLNGAKKLMTIENNFTGQFDGLIRQYTGIVPQEHLRKYDGRPFWPHEIVEKVLNVIKST